ncbi:hypothetical protein DVG80_04130 [Rhodococcus erythropolis]|nr:hypothetical protein DVG80_04130 [Rhodococcus erythropolis]
MPIESSTPDNTQPSPSDDYAERRALAEATSARHDGNYSGRSELFALALEYKDLWFEMALEVYPDRDPVAALRDGGGKMDIPAFLATFLFLGNKDRDETLFTYAEEGEDAGFERLNAGLIAAGFASWAVFEWEVQGDAEIEDFVQTLRESTSGEVRQTFIGGFEFVEAVLTESGEHAVTAWDGLILRKFTCTDLDELPNWLRETRATSDEAWRKWDAIPETDPVEVLPGIDVWTKGENLVGLSVDGGEEYFDTDDVATLISALQSALAQLGANK